MRLLWRLPAPARLVVAIALAIGVLGLRFGGAGLGGALWFQANLGYWFTLGLVMLWVAMCAKVGRARGWFTWRYWREHLTALLVIAGGAVFLHLFEPHMLRVFYDEPTHAMGAMVMHYERTALMADRSNWVGDQFVLAGFHTSFRPYIFSFLVSVLHDLTGYRVTDVFVLNFLLTPVVLWNAYLLGRRLAGRMAGLITVGLLSTVPLLAQVAASGSYDLLNVALLGGLVLLTASYLDSGDGPEQDDLLDLGLATVLLLSMARAESILYLLPWGGAVIMKWRRERRLGLTPFATFSPVFLLPNLMTNLILMVGAQGLYGGMKAAGGGFFSTAYLPQHVAETIYYFFSFDRDSTNSVLLAAVGSLGFVGLLVRVAGRIRSRTLDAVEGWVALIAVAVAAVYLFVLAQFWSSPIDAAAARFGLPLLFVGAVLGGWLILQVRWLAARPLLVGAVLLVWGVAATAPAMSRATQTRGMTLAHCEQWFLEFAGRNGRERVVYFEKSNYPLMANRFASADLESLGSSPEVFVRAIKAGLYRAAVVFQVFAGDPATGGWRCVPGNEVAANVVLETIEERVVSPRCKARISRLVGFRKPNGTTVTPDSDDPEIALRQSFHDDADRSAYWLSLYP